LERSAASENFVELAQISKDQRQSSKLLKPGSFDAYKNAAAPIIAI